MFQMSMTGEKSIKLIQNFVFSSETSHDLSDLSCEPLEGPNS